MLAHVNSLIIEATRLFKLLASVVHSVLQYVY